MGDTKTKCKQLILNQFKLKPFILVILITLAVSAKAKKLPLECRKYAEKQNVQWYTIRE